MVTWWELLGGCWGGGRGRRVLGAFGRFVAFTPLQFHPGLFCYKERGSRRYLFGSWGRLTPYLRPGDVRRGKDLTLHRMAPPTKALLPVPELPPYAMLAPVLPEHLLLDSSLRMVLPCTKPNLLSWDLQSLVTWPRFAPFRYLEKQSVSLLPAAYNHSCYSSRALTRCQASARCLHPRSPHIFTSHWRCGYESPRPYWICSRSQSW